VEKLVEIQAARVVIDSSLPIDDSLQAFILPYQKHLKEVLEAPLAYCPHTLTKTDGNLNSSLGNLMADILLVQADSVDRLQGGEGVSISILNHGGIRSIINRGPVNQRTAYEVMPFDNTIFIVTLDGGGMMSMLRFLAESGRAHPIAGMEIVLDSRNRLQSVSIGGRPFNPSDTFRVATSSYLVSGGDDMTFFGQAVDSRDTGYRIRDAMVDYFSETDTLHAQLDKRFIKESTP
jgi:2',3'-cyclic-nucleotide 2'-phosphodiesterase (5'-nucleotidase family)